MMSLEVFHSYNHGIAFLSSLLSNSLMCICLFSERNIQIRPYSNVLIIQCSADLLSATFFYLCSPRTLMLNGELIFVVTGVFSVIGDIKVVGVTVNFKYIAFSTYSFSMLVAFVCIPLNFWFRYNIICR